MKQTCKDCHFLFKEGDKEPGKSWEEDERENTIPAGGFSFDRIDLFFAAGHNHVGCYPGIWRKEITQSNKESLKTDVQVEIEKNRKDSCFFVEYRKEMNFDAAERLQKRSWDNEQLKKSLTRTQIGLIIAGLGVFGNLAWSLIQHFVYG